jgi:subtilisin family serine protease
MRSRAWLELARVAALAGIAAACFLTLRGSSAPGRAAQVELPPAQGLPGDLHPPVALGSLMIVVLRTPSVAARLPPGRLPTGEQERSWSAEDYAAQQQVLSELARHGIGVRPDYSFARVLDGFSAAIGPRALALLQQNPDVAGVYPVRVAYPATLTPAKLRGALGAQSAGVALGSLAGDGVTIALLDTGVAAGTPYLRGRVSGGIDIVGTSTGGLAEEAHGTELAGLLVGSGGPGGAQGVAPSATVLPIRVAAAQPDGHGGEALYARSDQLIAGLERAVDPGQRGELPGPVRIALIGLAEPFDSFPDSPEAQAIAGATALGVLVVDPAGDDGPAGPLYGSVAGPGGSPAALTVGAVDARRQTLAERLVVRQGLDVVADGAMPLLDAAGAARPLELSLERAGGIAAGGAVLVASGVDPVAAVTRAVARGARVVLLDGQTPAAGSLDGLAVPVVWVPGSLARTLRGLLARKIPLEAALGAVEAEPNPAFAGLAPFSSRGLAYDGFIDPELSAPGVDVTTALPGAGAPVYAALSGTAVAAASVAGAAALLVQERPGLDAGELASLLAGSAAPAGFSLSAGGVGVLDLGASAVGEVTASVTSLGFGLLRGSHAQVERTLSLRNVSTRPLTLRLATGSPNVEVSPAELTLGVGAGATIRLRARLAGRAPGGVLSGLIEVAPTGGERLSIPWTITLRPPSAPLLQGAALVPVSFRPSLARPALLQVRVGALPGGDRLELEPVARLELRLYGADGRYLGVLAGLSDLLPGRYAFALTGRSPTGERLPAGAYELALLAWPILGGAPTVDRVAFRIQ